MRDYVARLGIARPRVDDLVGRRDIKLFHLMVAALLEHGGPMGLDDIARRLRDAGVARGTDLERSLLKAWHGLAPVHRDPDGRFGLDLSSRELDYLLLVTHLRPPRFAPLPEPPPIEPISVAADVPLSPDELDHAFRGRYLSALSPLRQAAAVLDAAGRAMRVEEVEAVLAGLTPHRQRLTADGAGYWRTGLVHVDADGGLTLDRDARDIASMRRAVRVLGARAAHDRAREEETARRIAESQARHAADLELARVHATTARRAILHAAPSAVAPAVISVLDVEARTIRTFTAAEFAELRDLLAGYRVLAALQARDLLHTLGVDPNAWHVTDLGPPQKTLRLNQRGRLLRITTPMLITSTTGIGRPLGDAARMRAYLAARDHARLHRRLDADLKALYALYRYGVLHRYVRLQWGFLDELLHVDWALTGDVSLGEIVREAAVHGRRLDVVLGAAPGWQDPWARARRVEVLQADYDHVVVRDAAGMLTLHLAEIQAARPAAP